MTDSAQPPPTLPTELPADARTWLDRQARGVTSPWTETEIEFLAPGEVPRILDTSYLTSDDLANPDIAANVHANADTAALVTWIAQTSDKAYGYWRGPNSIPVAEGPLVEHDTEGQFHLVGAATISEALAHEVEALGGSRDDVLAVSRAAGITDELRDIDAWAAPEVSPTPQEHQAARYAQHRAGSS